MRLSPSPVITLRSATFGYADRSVVDCVDLTVKLSEVVALLGPNGSGKSTLVRGLLGLADHHAGEVELFGTPLARFTDRTRIGYVPQRHSLSTAVRATVTEIVAIGRLAQRPWWRQAGAQDALHVAEAIAAVGLTDRAHEEVSALSGGQQRRVLIARALAAQPDVLVMDEPTAGVDRANQEVLAEVLHRLAATGTTMLIVTHELDALSDVVTRIVCMESGHLDFDGTPDVYAAHLDRHSPGSGHHHEDEQRPTPGGVVGSGPLDPGGRRT